MTKDELRIHFRKLRQDFVKSSLSHILDAEIKRVGEHIDAAHVLGKTLGGYAAMGSELNPQSLLARWQAQSHAIALPWFADRQSPMLFRAADDDLRSGPFGIMQPQDDAAIVEPDTILVPLVAVDRFGNRIGQGQGHFDRTLAKLRETREIIAIGLAWDCQVAEALPADPWDQPLDYIATPNEIIKVTS